VSFVGLNCRNFGFSGSRIRFSAILDKVLQEVHVSIVDGCSYDIPSRRPSQLLVSWGDIFQGLSDDETFVVVRVVEGVEIQELLILP